MMRLRGSWLIDGAWRRDSWRGAGAWCSVREDGAVQNEGEVEVFASSALSALMVEALAGLECIELGLL